MVGQALDSGQLRETGDQPLPCGWIKTTLGEAFRWGSGGTPRSTKPQYYGGDIPWLIINDLTDGLVTKSQNRITKVGLSNSSAKWVEPGSILLAMYGSIGKLGIAGTRLTTNQAIAFTDPSPVNLKYLFYYLLSERRNLARLGKGATQQNISQTVIKAYPFVLAPLTEQERIVEAIETQFTRLDACTAGLKAIQAKLKRYRAAVLKAAVEGTLTAAWRAQHPDVEPASVLLQRILQERRNAWEQAELAKYAKAGKTVPKGWETKYRAPASPDIDDLHPLPDGWYWASLSQLGTLDRGRSRHRPRNAPHLYGGPYPFIQTGDVRRADTFIREYGQTYSEAGLQQSKLWPAGTLCITIAANIAETALLAFDACFPDSVVGFLAEESLISTRYVEIYLRTIRDDLEAYAPATAQKNINLETLNDVAIALSPRAEQEQIVSEVERRLSVVAEIEAQIQAALKRAERLRQSILREAFAGRLVPQNPEDEPADVLVKRIWAQKDGRITRRVDKQAVQLQLI